MKLPYVQVLVKQNKSLEIYSHNPNYSDLQVPDEILLYIILSYYSFEISIDVSFFFGDVIDTSSRLGFELATIFSSEKKSSKIGRGYEIKVLSS